MGLGREKYPNRMMHIRNLAKMVNFNREWLVYQLACTGMKGFTSREEYLERIETVVTGVKDCSFDDAWILIQSSGIGGVYLQWAVMWGSRPN